MIQKSHQLQVKDDFLMIITLLDPIWINASHGPLLCTRTRVILGILLYFVFKTVQEKALDGHPQEI